MLLRNARIAGESAPVDIRISDGTIAAIGADLVMTGDQPVVDAEVIDLGGRWVGPGLWDNHVHFSQWTLGSQRAHVATATSAYEAARMAGVAFERLGSDLDPAIPFVAVGFRDGLWSDAPNIADLDAISTTHPIVLVSGDLHAVWLNSPALALYGHAAHPTGLLREDEAFEVTRRIDSVPDAVIDAWARTAAQRAATRGVVGIVDLEMSWSHDIWKRRMDAGFDELRVEFGVYTQHLDRAIAAGLRTGDRVTELLSVGGYKVLTDGSLNTRTAYCYDDYPGLEGTAHPRGLLTVTPEQLVPLMRKAVAAGISPIVHAIGDNANTIALDAFEAVGSGGRIEHAQLLADSDFARFAALGVAASVQPDHAMDDRDVAERYWPGRTGRAFALRTLLDAGATLLLGSDAPVSELDPWVSIAAAVGRARDGREPWHPEQRISTAEALAASSRTTVAVRQRADLVVTDLDPLAANADDLKRMPVAATLLAGRFTHRAL